MCRFELLATGYKLTAFSSTATTGKSAEYLGYAQRAISHRKHRGFRAEWNYPRRLVVRCVPVRLFVLLLDGSFDSSGGAKAVDGARYCGRQQCNHLRDWDADRSIGLHPCQPVLYRGVCVQHPLVGESKLLAFSPHFENSRNRLAAACNESISLRKNARHLRAP